MGKVNFKPSRYLLLLIAVGLFVIPNAAQAICTSTLTSRLTVGSQGIVLPGAANNVRSEPSAQAELVGRISSGAFFTILEGAVCSGDFIWWRVESDTIQGWTVEANASDYFVQPIDGQAIVFENIFIDVPLELAADVESTHYIPDPEQPTTSRGAEHISFVFNEYPDDNHREHDIPQINVYRVDAFDEINTMLGDAGRATVEKLAALLEEPPDLYATYNDRAERLPDESPNVAQGLLAQMQYLNFENGRGYRFITIYTQNIFEPNNEGLLYRYVGMTNAGTYFVSATFPIEASVLPETPDVDFYASDDGSEYYAYIQGAQELFNAIPAENYTPDLTQLDTLLQSLYIGTE